MNTNPYATQPKAPFTRYLVAHFLTASALFLVLDLTTTPQSPTTVADVAMHLPIPAVLSALPAWLLTRRLRPPFWALLLIALPFFAGVLFIYEMGLLMAATQR